MAKAAIAVLVAVVLGWLMVPRAEALEARELWMYSAPAGAPDDQAAEPTFVGLMSSGATCSAVAEVMTAHMQTDQSKVVAAFQCQVHVITVQRN